MYADTVHVHVYCYNAAQCLSCIALFSFLAHESLCKDAVLSMKSEDILHFISFSSFLFLFSSSMVTVQDQPSPLNSKLCHSEKAFDGVCGDQPRLPMPCFLPEGLNS
jgi:hypothetical protein